MAKTSSGSKSCSKNSRSARKREARVPKPRPPIQISPDHDFRSRSKACEQLFLTREDADAFWSSLRVAFPRLHLVSTEHWKDFVDWNWWHAACDDKERREKAGLPVERVRHRMRIPEREPPRYWDSLGATGERDFYGWVLPEGWIPKWSEEDDFGVRRVANPPRLEFSFRRSRFNCIDRSPRRETVWFDDPPKPHNADEIIVLEDGELSIQWNPYDDEAETFAKTVFRILFKQVIDRFITVDRNESWRALSPTPSRNRRYGAAGRGAEAWALSRRHNYFFSPFRKPASYPFAPSEVLSAAELAALKAKWAAELEEEIAAGMQRNKELWEKWRRETEDA